MRQKFGKVLTEVILLIDFFVALYVLTLSTTDMQQRLPLIVGVAVFLLFVHGAVLFFLWSNSGEQNLVDDPIEPVS